LTTELLHRNPIVDRMRVRTVAASRGREKVKNRPSIRRRVRRVTTDSTHSLAQTFTGSAEEIARTMARNDVSPKGLASEMLVIWNFVNQEKHLSATRRRELERAKHIVLRRRERLG
jgi:hypothetical protein